MENPAKILVFDTAEQLALAAAERFVEDAHEAISEHDRFSVSLAGGNTPRRVYELLATEFRDRIHWSGVYLFFGDERCVPPDHIESNYRMVYNTMISKVAIPPKNVHRIIGERDPNESARLYEIQLRTFFAGLSWPRFDFVFLGMGEDGHAASLFPGSDALEEKSRWVVAVNPQQEGPARITLTLSVFNHAADILFLVTGKDKARRVAEVLRGTHGHQPVPAQLVDPVNGSCAWFLDKDGASEL
jgi:6-phosphogluconolactonase